MMRALNLKVGKTDTTPPPLIVGHGDAVSQVFERFLEGEYTSLRHLREDFLEIVIRLEEQRLRDLKVLGEPVLTLEGGAWRELPMMPI